MTKSLKANWYRYIVAIVVLAILLIGVAYAFYDKEDYNSGLRIGATNGPTFNSAMDHVQNIETPPKEILSNTSTDTKQRLEYLIEEEKLAHDVYLKMYEKYGARVFGNILKSETNHQSRVLTLLNVRNIGDPRSELFGVFNNQDLQKLYNNLIAQGNQSITEAYKVGVAIEELDIADIKEDLASTDQSQTDIIATLDSLLKGSENHLRAFSRQVR